MWMNPKVQTLLCNNFVTFMKLEMRKWAECFVEIPVEKGVKPIAFDCIPLQVCVVHK